MKVALQLNFRVLDPKIACDPRQFPLTIMAMHFPSLVSESQLHNLDDQRRSFRLSASELIISTENIPKYGNQINKIKDGLNNSKFNLLSYFMRNLSVLPYSSASVERIFFIVNSLKTKLTNKLKAETVKDRLLAKQVMTRNNGSCCTWEPLSTLIQDLKSGSLLCTEDTRIEL